MKLQSNRTLYFDVHNCTVIEENPKRMYDNELKAGQDYEFARKGTIFTVDEDEEWCEGYFVVDCKKFSIHFKDYNDMVESGWFDIVKGGEQNAR